MGNRFSVSSFVCRGVDFFYLPFVARVVDLRTFRYAFVGGVNVGFGVLFYWVLFQFILCKQDTTFFGIVTISAPILAFLINFVVTFFSGFWLTRNVAFGDSVIGSGVQLFRYLQVVLLNICINYFGLKLMVDLWEFYPTLSYLFLQILVVAVSYVASRFYTFKT